MNVRRQLITFLKASLDFPLMLVPGKSPRRAYLTALRWTSCFQRRRRVGLTGGWMTK